MSQSRSSSGAPAPAPARAPAGTTADDAAAPSSSARPAAASSSPPPPPPACPKKPPNAKKGKRKTPAKSRVRNWTLGECVGLFTAAATHWAALRSCRTALGKNKAATATLKAFAEATPAKDRAAARTRNIEQLERNIKSLRVKYMATSTALVQSGASTAEREDALLGFGGSVLYDLARGAFKKSSVSNEATVREPVVVGISAPPAPLAAPRNGDAGERAGEAPEEPSDQADGSESDATTDGEVAAPSAFKTLAAAEGSKPAKKPKETAAGDLRDYIKSKTEQEKADGSASAQGGPSSGGGDGNGLSDGAIRLAVLDMIVAYTEKTRRG